MKTTRTCLTGLLMVSSLFVAALAFADTMVITYRSGQVQHVAIEQPSEEVKDISYLKGPSSQLAPKEPTGKQAGQGGAKEPSADSKTPALKIKWAAPVDQ